MSLFVSTLYKEVFF